MLWWLGYAQPVEGALIGGVALLEKVWLHVSLTRAPYSVPQKHNPFYYSPAFNKYISIVWIYYLSFRDMLYVYTYTVNMSYIDVEIRGLFSLYAV